MEVESFFNDKVDHFFRLIFGQVKKGNKKIYTLTLKVRFNRGKQDAEK